MTQFDQIKGLQGRFSLCHYITKKHILYAYFIETKCRGILTVGAIQDNQLVILRRYVKHWWLQCNPQCWLKKRKHVEGCKGIGHVMTNYTFATLNMLSFIKTAFELVLTEGGIILLLCYIPELPRSFLSQKPGY